MLIPVTCKRSEVGTKLSGIPHAASENGSTKENTHGAYANCTVSGIENTYKISKFFSGKENTNETSEIGLGIESTCRKRKHVDHQDPHNDALPSSPPSYFVHAPASYWPVLMQDIHRKLPVL